jgi:hypothetical protein
METTTARIILGKIEEAPGKDYVEIPESERTPRLLLDKKEGIIKVEGRSLPENSNTFYNPVLEWIDKYVANPKEETKIVFDLEYYNSSSSKMLLQLFKKLSELKKNGKNVLVDWYYLEGDEDMLESGKTFEELSELSFDYICYV